MGRILEWSSALGRRLLSYRKTDWQLDDYPLRHVDQSTLAAWHEHSVDRSTWPRWRVDVIAWPTMTGTGDTPEEAYEALRRNLETYRDQHPEMPRPGVTVPVEIASTDRIDANRAIIDRIIVGALGLPAEDVFVSDDTCLADFAIDDEPAVADLQERIGHMFDVDIRYIEDGNLADIAEYIAERSPRV